MAVYERYGNDPDKRFNAGDPQDLGGRNFPLNAGYTSQRATQDWISRGSYKIGDLRLHNGIAYRSLTEHSNRSSTPPNDTLNWAPYNGIDVLREVRYRNQIYWPEQRSFTFETLRTSGQLNFKLATSTGYAAILVDDSYVQVCGPGEPCNELNPVKYDSNLENPTFIEGSNNGQQARQFIDTDSDGDIFGRQAYVTNCSVPLYPINTYTIEARGSTFDTYGGDLRSGQIKVKVKLKEMIGANPLRPDLITVSIKDVYSTYDESAKYHVYTGQNTSQTYSSSKFILPGEEGTFEFNGLRSSETFGSTQLPLDKEITLRIDYRDENGVSRTYDKNNSIFGPLLTKNIQLGSAGEAVPLVTKNLSVFSQSTYLLDQGNISVDGLLDGDVQNGLFEIPTSANLEKAQVAYNTIAGADNVRGRIETALVDIEAGWKPSRTKIEIIPLTKIQAQQVSEVTQTDISIQVERVGQTFPDRDQYDKEIPATSIYRLELVNGGVNMLPLSALPLKIGPSNHAPAAHSFSSVGLQEIYKVYQTNLAPRANNGNIRIITDETGGGAELRQISMEEDPVFNHPFSWNKMDWQIFEATDGSAGRYGYVPFSAISKKNNYLSQYIGNLNYHDFRDQERARVREQALEDEYDARVIYISGGYSDFVYEENLQAEAVRTTGSYDFTPRFRIDRMDQTPSQVAIPNWSSEQINKNIRVFEVTPKVSEEITGLNGTTYRYPEWEGTDGTRENYSNARNPEGGLFGTSSDREYEPEREADLFSVEFGPFDRQDIFNIEAVNEPELRYVQCRHSELSEQYPDGSASNMIVHKDVEIGKNHFYYLKKVEGEFAINIRNCPKFVQPLGKDWEIEYDFNIRNAPSISVAESAVWTTASGVRNDTDWDAFPYRQKRELLQMSARKVMQVMIDLAQVKFQVEAEAKNANKIILEQVNLGTLGTAKTFFISDYQRAGLSPISNAKPDYHDVLYPYYDTGGNYSASRYNAFNPNYSPLVGQQMLNSFKSLASNSVQEVPIKGVEVMTWSRPAGSVHRRDAAKLNIIAKFAPVRMYRKNKTYDPSVTQDGRPNTGFDEDDFVGFGFGNFRGNPASRSITLDYSTSPPTYNYNFNDEGWDRANKFLHPFTISAYGGPGVSTDVGSYYVLCSYISSGEIEVHRKTQDELEVLKDSELYDSNMFYRTDSGALIYQGVRMNGGFAFFSGWNWSPNNGQPDLKINRRFISVGGVSFVNYIEQGGGYSWRTGTALVVIPQYVHAGGGYYDEEFYYDYDDEDYRQALQEYNEWEDEDPEVDYEGGPSDTDNMPTGDDITPVEKEEREPRPPKPEPPIKVKKTWIPPYGYYKNTIHFKTYPYKTVNYGGLIGNVAFKYADSAFSGN